MKLSIPVDNLHGLGRVALAFALVSELPVPYAELEVSRHIVRFVFDCLLEFLEGPLGLTQLIEGLRQILANERNEWIDRQQPGVVFDDLLVYFPVLFPVPG